MFARVLRFSLRTVALVVVLALVGMAGCRLSAWRRERLLAPPQRATGRLVQAADLRVFVQEAGPATGPPVVLVHGTGAWSEIWRETLGALAQAGFRAIALDVPPFGYSDKPVGSQAYSRERQARRLIGLLDTLGLSRVTLVGHSVGARPTVEAALLASERVEKLVLVDPALGFAPQDSPDGAHFEQNRPPLAARVFFAITPLRNAVLASVATNPAFTRRLFRSFVSVEGAVTDARVRMLQEPLAMRGTTSAYGDWLSYLVLARDTSLASDFANFRRLSMPVLIVWGSADTVTPPWQGQELQGLIPGSRLQVLEGVGHIPYVEDPVAFNSALLGFLAPQVALPAEVPGT